MPGAGLEVTRHRTDAGCPPRQGRLCGAGNPNPRGWATGARRSRWRSDHTITFVMACDQGRGVRHPETLRGWQVRLSE